MFRFVLVVVGVIVIAMVFAKLWAVMRPVRDPLHRAQIRGLRRLGFHRTADWCDTASDAIDEAAGVQRSDSGPARK